MRLNIFDWGNLGPNTGGRFYDFCDALEVKDGMSASASGWGMEHALDAWGIYWKQSYLAECKGLAFKCDLELNISFLPVCLGYTAV